MTWKAEKRSIVSSFIIVPDALRVVDFAKTVFGAVPLRQPLFREDGSLWNVELDIGGSTVMIGEATDESFERPAFLYVQVEDCDAVFERALAAGAETIMTPEDRFYGDRDGGVQDPAGNWWWIATHKEDLSADEIERRARAEEARSEAAGDR